MKKLGQTTLEVSPLMLGGNVFGWTADEKTSFAILDAFVDAGYNFVDTADIYSHWAPGHTGGESETVIGKWFRASGKRSKVVIATKVGGPMGKDDSKKGLKKDYILREVEDSLRRLQTDHIDLYQSHFDDTTLPVEEPLEAYAALVKAGKVRFIGASNFTPARLRAALAVEGLPHYASLQPLYNLMEREAFEKELEPICAEHGLGVVPYYSLAAGFLTGKYRTEADLGKSTRGGGVKKYLTPKGLGVLKALDEVSARHQTDLASVALAWLMARPTVTAPIASATSVAQLQSLFKGAQLELNSQDIVQLDLASAWKLPVANG
ncbi:aldo/keto reductase [Dinghuibacter silviterrae]|uniref:Aryl-alcohol dehydrogenase-like predicted oxidoreductase n=1 Tax=Dinghuibacter silviterrae TaxID=1539049 RepID=A0A4R8DJ69_9BACT|nr:aldo/keto reductase [Dinghuibacter silviterrae]TDW97374.1 aryl-alcohol dehydrogenase-like predicted oxidoreductase [Dinghuibacter silviterrae]